MNYDEYMRYVQKRIAETKLQTDNPSLFNAEKEQAKMKQDQEMFDQYMKSMTSLSGWFPSLENVPIIWIVIGIVSGIFLFMGVLL